MDMALLQLWFRPDAAPVQPLVWELPCAAGVDLKKKKKREREREMGQVLCILMDPLCNSDVCPNERTTVLTNIF